MPISPVKPVVSLFSPSREFHRILILLVGSTLIFAAGIGMRSLWNPNEPVYGEGVREMMARHDYYLPYVNGTIYADKPIFFFWVMLASCWITGGLSEAALRIPSVLGGVLSVLIVYRLGHRMFGIRAGFLAATCLATSVMFWWHSQYVQMDQLLSLLILGSLALFFPTQEMGLGRPGIQLAFSGALMGLAFLTKGPVGLLLPGATLGAYLFFTREWRWILRREAAWMALAFLLFATPWYGSLALTGHSSVLSEFFIRHNLERATDPFNHQQPFWYYFPRLFSDLFPWSLFLPAALFTPTRNPLERRGRLFVLLWLALVLLIFSAAGSKRGVYLLPLYPAAALLLGKYWDEILSGEISVRLRRWASFALGFLGAFFTAFFLLGSVTWLWALRSGRYREEASWVLPLGVAALLCGLGLFSSLRRSRVERALVVLTVTMAFVFFYADLALLPLADRYKSPVPFCQRVTAQVGPDDEIRSYGLWRWDSSYLYYTGRLMPHLRSFEEVESYLARARKVFLLVESSEMDRFLSRLKVPVEVLARQDIGHQTAALLVSRP